MPAFEQLPTAAALQPFPPKNDGRRRSITLVPYALMKLVTTADGSCVSQEVRLVRACVWFMSDVETCDGENLDGRQHITRHG